MGQPEEVDIIFKVECRRPTTSAADVIRPVVIGAAAPVADTVRRVNAKAAPPLPPLATSRYRIIRTCLRLCKEETSKLAGGSGSEGCSERRSAISTGFLLLSVLLFIFVFIAFIVGVEGGDESVSNFSFSFNVTATWMAHEIVDGLL